ncbi:type VI secretion system tip protein VgrG [Pseudomonas sp. PCH199]|uniref:type VI secretion system Vgr family protein n=1 Tax=unclassified Pseudomonas TaxID=196821 RepID=UPI000BDD87CA|nr:MULTISPECIES: type VI secretion system tip protein VgrG [unclassified Pseudomonas]MCW8276307.1 type VI secretion system tip protein VgrG [Pseudomonas sp. PCH199]PAM83692.1 type IV secretion protein Rhs [Pseudomonas sp. ERMR1:02]
MSTSANQSRFTLCLQGEPKLDFKVLEFTGMEAISQPYRFDLELVSEKPDIELEPLLQRQAYLSFGAQGHGIHGQIFRIGQGDSGKRLTRYQISLVPRLICLGQRINQRIFQHQSVPTIITQILKDHGILGDAFKFQLHGTYPEREYCVQYAESDLAFIQRLSAEIGIHYHFQHSPDGHLLVFGDGQSVFPRLPESTRYLPGSGMTAQTPVVDHFNVRLETRTNAVVRRDYDFHKPRLELESRSDIKPPWELEDYGFPGQFNDREVGDHLAGRALERHRADYQMAQGRSDQISLTSGYLLKLEEHPRKKWNEQWLLTEIEHHGRQPQVLEESAGSDDTDYRNTFLATPWDVFFRPPLLEKPRVVGYQSAVVTGPKNSEIHCDEYGRVKVRLMWDRDGPLNEQSSCWLRVASGWAHDHYGGVLIPRVGMEVLVGFVDADADKPLVMGCVPNAATPVPLDLPADKTRSIFRSQSSPGGGGYNELRIEDRKGAEEISLRAQRNWDQQVLHDMHVHVGRNEYLHVNGDRHISVSSQTLKASGQFRLNAGNQIVIDGGASATIQAGGHWINIGPEGIFSSVPIEVGGALVPAIGASSTPVQGVPLSMVQILNLKRAAPFCQQCCEGGFCAI